MRTLNRIFLFLFFVGTARAQISPQIVKRLQDTVAYMQATKKYKGISAAASLWGTGEWKGTAGISHQGEQLTDSMVIGIGSNTKTFIATVILRLAEMQMLSLDDSLGKWLPPIKNVKGSITVRQLLNHTSGIYNYTEHASLGDSVMTYPFRVWTKAELVARFVKAPLFAPGAGWSYSNTNYLLAGMIAEAAASQNVAQLVRLIVLDAAGLDNTFFPPYETITADRAKVWSDLGNGYLQAQTLPVEFYSLADAAGGMISDAADNCTFWEKLFGGTIISKTTIRTEMLNWKQVNSSIGYGLGVMKQNVQGNIVFTHGGSILGQHCANLTDTVNGITVSVLSNQDSILNEPVVYGLYKILLHQKKLVGLPEGEILTMQVFPNPASSVLKVVTSNAADEAMISDVTGRVILRNSGFVHKTEVDVSALPKGLYYLTLRSNGEETTSKFIKD